MNLSAEGEARAADDILKSVIPMAEASLALLDEMISASDRNIRLVSTDVNASASSSIIFLLVLATVLVVFAAVLSFVVISAIRKYIADLREAEFAAGEASRMKSVFLANMSHEIRTPMNGIIGFSELALDDSLSPRTRDYLEKIKYSSVGLLQIINDVLDVSKIEAGRMELEVIPFNIQELFRICQAIVAPKALDKGITLYCYAEPSIGRNLLGDPTKLRQVLLNLLSNAVKFTNVGIVKLLSNVSEISEDSVTIHFEIKDSGIGMTPAQISKVFEPFSQADNGTTRKYGGTGLGLPITKDIIRLMGGELIAESTPGVGSKFSFDLTFKTIYSPDDITAKELVVDQFEKPVFNGEVLVCEDNAMNQQVICDHLARVGLKCVVAVNGKEGVEYVLDRINNNEPPFDLIFMDIHMPVMDGIEAAKELQKIGIKTPIVPLSANIMPDTRETYRMCGMPDYLAKPFTSQELWACLLKYITPVSLKAADVNEQSEADKKLHNQLLSNFLKDNQTTFRDIKNAVNDGDIRLAHRLAHTLGSVAGLIGKTTLQETARAVEHALANEKSSVTDVQLQALELELGAVLAELEAASVVSRPQDAAEVFDRDKALGLIEKLEPLLKAGDTDCLDMADELATIPGSLRLVELIERFDFKQAIQSLNDLKLNMESE